MVKVAIAGPSVYAVSAGEQVVAAGGNAVDATLASLLAAMVSEPGVASLGGGGFVTVAPLDGEPLTIDGSVAMPGLGREPGPSGPSGPSGPFGMEPLWLEYGGGTQMDVGPASVATPGTLIALELAHRRFGRAPWAQVVGPAADLARKGFRIGAAAGNYLGHAAGPLFGRDAAARAALSGPDGRTLGCGDTMVQPELGDFLDLVAVEGAAALHRGEVARALVAEMATAGGLITADDLAGYCAVVRPSLTASIGGWRWATNPAPAVGGPVLIAMLHLLSDGSGGSGGSGVSDPASGRWPSPAELVAVQEAVLSYRVRRLDVAPDRIAAAGELLATVAGRGIAALGSPSTVHVSSVDADGLACAATASAGYGAGVSVPGTGVWLNNCLGERELNRRGPHALMPGERLVSNMAPTVGRHVDGRVLAVGSPGADRIVTAVLQTLLGLLAGDTLTAAIGRPRVHVTCDAAGRPTTVEYEADFGPRPAPAAGGEAAGGEAAGGEAAASGAAAGLRWREHPAASMFFGGVAAALRHADGRLEAAADARREGGVVVAG